MNPLSLMEVLLNSGWQVIKIDYTKVRPAGSEYYINAIYRNSGMTANGYGSTLSEAIQDVYKRSIEKSDRVTFR